MKILIFLPTYNEKENIGKIIDSLIQLKLDIEILVVDDNSTDGTLEIIKRKLNQFNNLTLIRRTGKKGRGLAGITGLKYFIKSDFDIFIEMDADFSHHPKFIPNFLQYFPKYDVIIGSRLIAQGKQEGRAKIRCLISLISNLFIRLILGVKIKDCTSGYRAFNRKVLKKLDFDRFISINPEIVEELLYGCVLTGANIIETPITFYEREGGESKLNTFKLFHVLINILKIRIRGKKIIKE